MKRNLIQYTLCGLGALTLAHSAYAHEEEKENLLGNPVSTPVFEGGVTASIGTFYVTPSAENEYYGASLNSNVEEDISAASVLNVDPGYDFGIQATLGYIFENTANGIELSFRNITTSDSDSAAGIELNGSIDEPGDLHSNLGYELNAFDLMISQFIDIGNNMQMRFAGGLAYVELEQTQDTSFEPLDPAATDSAANNKSEFTGWGPRLGIDARYDFGQGFGIVAGGSVAYFLGELTIDSTLFAHDLPNQESLHVQNEIDSHGVTNLRGNLGIDYVFFFDDEASTLGLELGYLADYYADGVGNLNGIDFATIDNFATTFSGPYVNLKGVF
jgi:hypothetical protein